MKPERTIRINIDSAIGQRIYWLIVELTKKYQDDFKQIKIITKHLLKCPECDYEYTLAEAERNVTMKKVVVVCPQCGKLLHYERSC